MGEITMKTKLILLIVTSFFATGFLLALSASAQEDNPWNLNADVDNDGLVGPTDIQHVVNGALGFDDRGPDAVNLPVRQYIVASPRVALSLNPQTEDAGAACGTLGAAYNFPRDNGRMLLRQGTLLFVRFDRNIEGVWYENACGLLGSRLTLEARRLVAAEGEGEEEGEGEGEGENGPRRPDQAAEGEGEGEGEIGEDWTLVGVDGARANLCGPAFATANIGVRQRFLIPGDYLLRATIESVALPQSEVAEESEVCGGARAVDEVLLHVRVIGREPRQEDHEWQEQGRPDEVPWRYGLRLNQDENTTGNPQ